jgi:hypothetical protein
MASNLEVAARSAPASIITVKKDGLAQVHPSTSQTVLYPTMNEEGLRLISARKHCMSELVRVGSNPAYTLSLISLADTLDSMLLDHAFSCSEAGRFFKEHQPTLRAELLEHQRDVDANRRSLASVWDAVMWQPLVDAYGQPTVDDQHAIVQLVLFEDLNGKVVERGHSVIAWLHHVYVERSELLVPEILAQVMAKAVKMAIKYCSSSERYSKKVPRYMAEFTTFLHSLQQNRMSQADAARFFKHLRQRARDEDAGNRLLADASSDSSTGSSERRCKGKSKSKARGKHRARVLPTAHGSSSEEEDLSDSLRAGAYAAIAGLRSQPSGPHLPQPPPLSVLEPKVHALMLKFAHVPVVWLQAILGGLPMDLPQHIPHGSTVKTCYYGPNPPCASCSSKCAGCGWNSQHTSQDCQWIKPFVDRLLNQQRNQGNGGGRGAGRHGGNGGGERHGANSGGQAYPIQLAPSVTDPGPSASVAGGGEPYTFTASQVSALMQQAARATSPTPRSSSGSVISQPLTTPLFTTPLPAASRVLQQADLRQCFVVQHTQEDAGAPALESQSASQTQRRADLASIANALHRLGAGQSLQAAAIQDLEALLPGLPTAGPHSSVASHQATGPASTPCDEQLVGLHRQAHGAGVFSTQVGPRGFTQASPPAADYTPPRAGPAGRVLPPGVTSPAAHLPHLKRPAAEPAEPPSGLHPSAAGLSQQPPSAPVHPHSGLHSSAALRDVPSPSSAAVLQGGHVSMSMGFERYGRILVPALRHPSFSGLRVTVRGRTQDIVALLQLIDGPSLPSLCEPEDTPPLAPHFACPLGAVPNWFSQALPVDLGNITAALTGPVHVISAVLAASQRLPPPQATPVQQATTLALRTAAPTSPAWASDRNGSLPTLTQDPEQPAFQLRMGADLGRVETPNIVRPDTCATGTFWGDAFAGRMGVETVETHIVATGVGGSQAVRTTRHPVAHILNPGTAEERVVVLRPLIVANVKEEQFQVLLGIDFLHAAGVSLDMSACRLSYMVDTAGRLGSCAFTMAVPSSLLLTETSSTRPTLGLHSSADELGNLYPLAPLVPPHHVSLYVLTSEEPTTSVTTSSGDPSSSTSVGRDSNFSDEGTDDSDGDEPLVRDLLTTYHAAPLPRRVLRTAVGAEAYSALLAGTWVQYSEDLQRKLDAGWQWHCPYFPGGEPRQITSGDRDLQLLPPDLRRTRDRHERHLDSLRRLQRHVIKQRRTKDSTWRARAAAYYKEYFARHRPSESSPGTFKVGNGPGFQALRDPIPSPPRGMRGPRRPTGMSMHVPVRPRPKPPSPQRAVVDEGFSSFGPSLAVVGPARATPCFSAASPAPRGELPPHITPRAAPAAAPELPPHLAGRRRPPPAPAPALPPPHLQPVGKVRPPVATRARPATAVPTPSAEPAPAAPASPPAPSAEPAPAAPAPHPDWHGMGDAAGDPSWAVPASATLQELAVALTSMWRHHAGLGAWPAAAQAMRHLLSMHEGRLQTSDGVALPPHHLEEYTTPSAWNKTKARVKLMREWTTGELHARRGDNTLPRTLTNALPPTAQPTQRSDKLTDEELECWFEAFRAQLGLPDGAQPNPDQLLLPPPPTYGCKPGERRRDEDDPGPGPGPGFNPAAALLRRLSPAKRSAPERPPTQRDRRDATRRARYN